MEIEGVARGGVSLSDGEVANTGHIELILRHLLNKLYVYFLIKLSLIIARSRTLKALRNGSKLRDIWRAFIIL